MIPRIVLTGGPCGGKTSTLTYLKTRLPELGVTPVFVPELATMLNASGIRWLDIGADSDSKGFKFQAQMIEAQIKHEDMIYGFAHLVPGHAKVVICDRGTIDNMAYAKDEWHDDILSQVGTMGFLKRRYDMIVHLNTLAYGDGYVLDNPARYEDQQGAIDMDKRTFSLWAAGPYVPHIRIMHEVSLDAKQEQVAHAIREFIDL